MNFLESSSLSVGTKKNQGVTCYRQSLFLYKNPLGQQFGQHLIIRAYFKNSLYYQKEYAFLPDLRLWHVPVTLGFVKGTNGYVK
jgi:hypothetical protein